MTAAAEEYWDLAGRYFDGQPLRSPVVFDAAEAVERLAEHIGNVAPRITREQRNRLAALLLTEPPS